MNVLRLSGLGCEGFASGLLQLHVLGILDHDELLRWLRLHGALFRLEAPLDTGAGIDEEALEAHARGLGGRVE